MREKGHRVNRKKAWSNLQKYKNVPYEDRADELRNACRKYLLGDEA